MTNEKMLEIMLSIKEDLDKGECYPGMTFATVPETIKQLEEDIRHDCQKKKGNVKRDNLLKKMLKCNREPRMESWGSHYTPYEDQYGFLDGYRAYVLNDPMGYTEVKGQPFNLKACIPHGDSVNVHVDVADVQTFIKTEKAAGRTGARGKQAVRPYGLDAGAFKIYFNPTYLVEFCQMFNTDTIKVFSQLSPVMCEAENGEWGILLPVRHKEEA